VENAHPVFVMRQKRLDAQALLPLDKANAFLLA
jgi:hypothetical protein